MDASGSLPPRKGMFDFVRVTPTTPNSNRLVYDPENPDGNKYETNFQRPATQNSDWDLRETANKAVRRLELEKIGKLDKPAALKALEEYNRRQKQWMVWPKYKLGLFYMHDAEFFDYRKEPNTQFEGMFVREYLVFNLGNWRTYKDWIEPAESGFGFSRRGINHRG